jgi:hypothetical protein
MKDPCPFLRCPRFTHDVSRPAACERPPRRRVVPAHCDIQQGGRLAARAGACAPRLACGPCGEALPVSCPRRRWLRGAAVGWMRGAAVWTGDARIRSAYSLFDSICLLPPSHVAAVPGVRQRAFLFAALAPPGVAARWPSSWGGPAWRSPRLVPPRSGGGRQARSGGGQAATCRSRRACGAVRLLRPGPHLPRRVVQSAPGPRRSSPPTAPRGSGAVGGAAPIRQRSSWGARLPCFDAYGRPARPQISSPITPCILSPLSSSSRSLCEP